MKKILIVLLAILMLTACSAKKEEDKPNEEQQEVIEEETNVEITGGWTINNGLPEMNDAYFDKARKELTGVNYQPLFVLGTQVVAGENMQYLCYATAVSPNAKPSYKVVTVNKDENNECKITAVEDFNISDYLDDKGSTTPEGLVGGWQDNSEFPNMLNDDEKEIFGKALDGLVGVSYEPIATLATQVVAGTNYAFLAKGTSVTANPVNHLYVISVYKNLEGNAELKNICGIDLSRYIAK